VSAPESPVEPSDRPTEGGSTLDTLQAVSELQEWRDVAGFEVIKRG
jgi:hypothetical protein